MTDNSTQPGLPDRMVDWINNLPIPKWLFYLILIVVLGLINSMSAWSLGTRPWGVFEFESATDGIWPTFFVAMLVMLVNRGRAAFDKYRPLLPADAHNAELENRFTVISRRTGRIGLLVGAFFVLQELISRFAQGLFTVAGILSTVYFLTFLWLVGFAFTATLLFLLRQIRIIQRLHREAEGVDLFHLAPAHAFSELTAGTGISLMLTATFGVIQVWNNPANTYYFVLDAVLMAFGVMAFFLPLQGMRRKLREVKAEELHRANQRVKDAYEHLTNEADAGNYDKLGAARTAFESLASVRNEIARVSTLPWETSTFRGFASAFLLPILLFIATQLIGRFL